MNRAAMKWASKFTWYRGTIENNGSYKVFVMNANIQGNKLLHFTNLKQLKAWAGAV